MHVQVSGALVIRAVPGAKVHVRALKVANEGWTWQPLQEGERAPEELLIRCAHEAAVGAPDKTCTLL